MDEPILMAIIGPLVALIGFAIAANAALSPGAENQEIIGPALFLLGLVWFVIGVVRLLGWVS